MQCQVFLSLCNVGENQIILHVTYNIAIAISDQTDKRLVKFFIKVLRLKCFQFLHTLWNKNNSGLISLQCNSVKE